MRVVFKGADSYKISLVIDRSAVVVWAISFKQMSNNHNMQDTTSKIASYIFLKNDKYTSLVECK